MSANAECVHGHRTKQVGCVSCELLHQHSDHPRATDADALAAEVRTASRSLPCQTRFSDRCPPDRHYKGCVYGELAEAQQAIARLTAKVQELEEERPNYRADSTGHLFRCARVNGVWSCHKGCAVAAKASLEADVQRLTAENAGFREQLDSNEVVTISRKWLGDLVAAESSLSALQRAIQQMVEKWRAEADGSRAYDPVTGDVCGHVWDRCADELSTLHPPPS